MENVYLWKAGDKVIHHTDIEAAAQLDGLVRQPDKTVSEAEFEAANGLVRIIEGEIVLGQTDDEKVAEENEVKIAVLKRKLADTDYISAKIAEGSATIEDYAEEIAQRQAWRREINGLAAT